jgi:tetratricopeptide (TPR) repeat protein
MKSNKICSIPVNQKFTFLINVLLIFFLSCTSLLIANENNNAFDSANVAYAKGNYEKAIKLYTIINKGFEAPELYFNLGNAYYKTDNIGLAILNYERAKKLSPGDENIIANLKLVSQKTEDKIDAAPQLFLTEWKDDLVNLMNEKQWSILCIVMMIIAVILWGTYFFSNQRGLKQLGFFGGILIFISAIAIFFIAQYKYKITKNSNDAIITSASVVVTGSPSEKGTKLFVLHEGTKVYITQQNNDWIEVRIANGNVGWMKASQLQKI